MDGTRIRLMAFVEWLLAAACVAGVLAGAGVLSGEIGRVRPVVPVLAGPAPVEIDPAGLHPGAISVPMLVLPDGKQLQVGAAADTLTTLGREAQDGPTLTEKVNGNTRESRSYRYAGLQFVVVTAADEVVAIYR